MKDQRKFDLTIKLSIITVIIAICFLSVGFSSFTATNRIENIMASVRPEAEVRITNISINNTSNGGISNSEQYNISKIYGNITLPNANSTVTYKVDVTVFLGAEMKLTSITGLDSNLEYSISGYTLGDTLCNSNNVCNYGATDDIYITIGYKSGSYDGVNTTFNYNLDFNFEQVVHVSKVGNQYFESLQDAVDAVQGSSQTTVQLLKNHAESFSVPAGKNIILNLNGYTLSNGGDLPVIENDGTITFTNGTITTNATQGAINNNSTATFIMNDGSIIASGTKQALYNYGGRAEIGGTAYLKNTAGNRPAVHNKLNGTLIITGGTIEGPNYFGVQVEDGTLTLGTKDGIAQNVPLIVGKNYGVSTSTNINYYDGIVKGLNNAFNDETYLYDMDPALTLNRTTEKVGNNTFKVVQLVIPVTITFNANGGSVSETSRTINKGNPVGTLPAPTRTNYEFLGWFDAASGGNEIDENEVFTSDIELFAHWQQTTIARIGNTNYPSVQAAVSAASNQGPTTINLVKSTNVSTRISTNTAHNITFELNGYTITGLDNIPIFENDGGVITVRNGTIVTTTSTTQGAVNNRVAAGSLTLDGVTINARGKRQAVYNKIGTTYIYNCNLTTASSERAAVHNLENGTTYIYSGTISATNFSAVYNESGTLYIGTKDGNINSSNPSITGSDYGVLNSGTLNYYDGIIKGITDSISGTISDQEGTLISGTDGNYTTAHLE